MSFTNGASVSLVTAKGARYKIESATTLGEEQLDQMEEITAGSYTLVAADNGKTKLLNKTTTQTITLPGTLPIGFNCRIFQKGVGRVVLSAGAGASVVSNHSLLELTQYGQVALSVRENGDLASAVYDLEGDLTPVVMTARRLALLTGKNTDGSSLAAAASGANFGISLSGGHSLQGVAAQNNTKTNSAIFEGILPDDYVAGTDFSITVNAILRGTGTAGTKTVAVIAKRIADDGTVSANLVTTAAAAFAGAAADYVFAVTGTTFSPGNRVQIEVDMVVQETANVTTLTGQLNSVRLS